MADIYVRNVGSNTSPYDTWAKAATTLASALAIATNADTIWLASDHNESTGGAVTLICPTTQGLRILSSNTTTTEPPTGLSTTASVAVGSASAALAIVGFAYVYGVKFLAGTNANALCSIHVSNNASPNGTVFESCAFELRGGNTAINFQVGAVASNQTDDVFVKFLNCSWKFANASQTIRLQQGRVLIQNMALDGSGSTPTTLFGFSAATSGQHVVEASDLSGVAFTSLAAVNIASPSTLLIRNCKIPASMALTTGASPGVGGPLVRMHNCDDGSTNYRIAEGGWAGTVVSDTGVYNDAGVDDGSAQGFSWKMTTSASALFPSALLESPEMVKWNTTTGSSKTVTVEIVHDGAVAFENDEVWLEVQYLSASGTPLGAIVTDCVANVLSTPAAQTTSTAAWTGDTGTGPNGSATWNTLKLECTFTPEKAGYIHAKVVMAVPSKTVFVDPLMTVA